MTCPLVLTELRAVSRKMPSLTLTALHLLTPSIMPQLQLLELRHASSRSQGMPVSPKQTELPCNSGGRSPGGLQWPVLVSLRLVQA